MLYGNCKSVKHELNQVGDHVINLTDQDVRNYVDVS